MSYNPQSYLYRFIHTHAIPTLIFIMQSRFHNLEHTWRANLIAYIFSLNDTHLIFNSFYDNVWHSISFDSHEIMYFAESASIYSMITVLIKRFFSHSLSVDKEIEWKEKKQQNTDRGAVEWNDWLIYEMGRYRTVYFRHRLKTIPISIFDKFARFLSLSIAFDWEQKVFKN